MKSNFLFPHCYKAAGWVLLLLGLGSGLVYLLVESEPSFLEFRVPAIADNAFMDGTYLFSMVRNNMFDEITGVLIIIGALFVAFSRGRVEDEFIDRIRLDSLMWATYINYSILVLAILFVYGMSFFWVLVFNMFTTLIFFIIRFNWVYYKSKKLIRDEK